MKSQFRSLKPAFFGAAAVGALALTGCGGGTSAQNSGPTPTATPSAAVQNTIVFASSRSGNNDIYSIRSDGSQGTQLTTAAGDDNTPSRSRDGSRIVFSSLRAGNAEIYTMGSAGETSGLQRLTTDTDANAPIDTEPTFSADGTRIAWVSTRGGGANIWIMDSTGANQRQLTTEGNVSSPAFSPDGSAVAFSVARPQTGTTGGTVNSVVIAKDITTGTERTLVQGDFSALFPRYNPSGSQLLYVVVPTGGARSLRVRNLSSGTDITDVGGGSASNNISFQGRADFSPDGTRIVGEISVPSGGTIGSASQIGVASATSGSTITPLVTNSNFIDFAPSWGN